MAKRSIILVAFLIIISLSLVLASCQELPEKKPDYSAVLDKYSKAAQKRATAFVNIDFDMNFFLNVTDFTSGNQYIKFSQIGEFDRIDSGGKIIVDIDAYADKSDMGLIPIALRYKGFNELADVTEDYFKNKNTIASLLLGYDGRDTYNMKAGYYKKGKEREYQAFYAINHGTIESYQSALMLASCQKIVPKNILMLNDIFSVVSNPDYLVSDCAPTRYDEQERAFLYSFIFNNQGFKEHIFQIFEQKILSYLVNEYNSYAQETYEYIEDTIREWFNIESTYMKARANSDSELTETESGIKLKIIVPNRDVKYIANLLSPGSGEEFSDLISNISINIDIKVNEQYSYEEDLPLVSYSEQDLFASTTLNIEDRIVITIEDLLRLTETE